MESLRLSLEEIFGKMGPFLSIIVKWFFFGLWSLGVRTLGERLVEDFGTGLERLKCKRSLGKLWS